MRVMPWVAKLTFTETGRLGFNVVKIETSLFRHIEYDESFIRIRNFIDNYIWSISAVRLL